MSNIELTAVKGLALGCNDPAFAYSNENLDMLKHYTETFQFDLPKNPRADMIPKLPIVIIINGAGGTGKDTFVNYLEKFAFEFSDNMFGKYNMLYGIHTTSTVDLVYEAIYCMLNKDKRDVVKDMILKKSDEFRQFMHEIKMSWTKFNDGPMNYIISQYNNCAHISECMNGLFKNPRIQLRPKFAMTVMSREAEEIHKFKEIFNQAGVLVLTVFVDGITSAKDYKNDCDSKVTLNAYPYDLVIHNPYGHEDQLEHEAYDFTKRLLFFYLSQYYTCTIDKM